MSTVDVLCLAIAVLALAGWTFVNAHLSRSLLPLANSLGALAKVDALIDDRIAKVIERIRERQNPLRSAPAASPVAPPPSSSAADALRDIFGGAPLEPIEEQPDGLEVRD